MIVSEYGSVLTQKKEPRMVFIKPIINMETNVLILKCQGLFVFDLTVLSIFSFVGRVDLNVRINLCFNFIRKKSVFSKK